jgi:hypothetical protein
MPAQSLDRRTKRSAAADGSHEWFASAHEGRTGGELVAYKRATRLDLGGGVFEFPTCDSALLVNVHVRSS